MITNNQNGQISYPNFDTITKLVKGKIESNFPKYANSWEEILYNGLNNDFKEWWEKRLQTELDELKKCKSDGERQKELLDILAVASFMLESLHRHGDFIWNDRWWRYP